MNVSGPSGSNYNPFRTENDKPTSNEAITGMGKLSGDYSKGGNWFFRKVYDSVSALFSGKYWKGGWFAPKQSGSGSGSTVLSGRVASVSSHQSSISPDDLLSSGELTHGQGEDAFEMTQPISDKQYKEATRSQAARDAKVLSQLRGIETRDEISTRRKEEAILKQLDLSHSDVEGYEEAMDVKAAKAAYDNFFTAHQKLKENPEPNASLSSSDTFAVRQQFRQQEQAYKDALEAYQSALSGLAAAGLSYNSQTGEVSKKK